jgi:predicted O-methyltransferase YrrM
MTDSIQKHHEGTTLGRYPILYPYVMKHMDDSDAQRALRDQIDKESEARMSGAPDEAAFFGWLIGLTGAKKVLEVGVFRGATTLAMALALPADGKVVGLDVSEEFVATGKTAWTAAGVAGKIDLRIAPATESMERLLQEGAADTFDLCFIDADKENYEAYYEFALKLVKVGGIIAVDNVLWGGRVLNPQASSDRAIVAINEKIRTDKRVHATMLPIADGVYMVRRVV